MAAGMAAALAAGGFLLNATGFDVQLVDETGIGHEKLLAARNMLLGMALGVLVAIVYGIVGPVADILLKADLEGVDVLGPIELDEGRVRAIARLDYARGAEVAARRRPLRVDTAVPVHADGAAQAGAARMAAFGAAHGQLMPAQRHHQFGRRAVGIVRLGFRPVEGHAEGGAAGAAAQAGMAHGPRRLEGVIRW